MSAQRMAALRPIPVGKPVITFRVLNVQGTGAGGNGAIINSAAGTTATLTPTFGISLTGATSVGAAANATLALNAPISGNFALTKVGAGTVVLASGSTFAGNVTLSQGFLGITADSSLGNAANTLFLATGSSTESLPSC